MRWKMIVAAVVLGMSSVLPLVGCSSMNSEPTYGRNDVGQAGYPKAPWGNSNSGMGYEASSRDR